MNKLPTQILVVVFILISNALIAQETNSNSSIKYSSNNEFDYHYEPVEGKLLGIWPHRTFWNLSTFSYFKDTLGFEFIMINPRDDDWRLSPQKYETALEAGFENSNISVVMREDNWEWVINNISSGMYYLGEPTEHNCSGDPSSSVHTDVFRPDELDSIRDTIRAKNENAEFIIDGYKRCSHLKIAANSADHIMYSSYTNWTKFGLFKLCTPDLGWGDNLEYGWLDGSDDQSNSWSDMKNQFGNKFDMSWVHSGGDEYSNLFDRANQLNLEVIWLYDLSTEDLSSIEVFCAIAEESGWLKKVYENPLIAPQDFIAIEDTIGRVQLNWADTSKFVVGYLIGRRLYADNDFKLIETVVGNIRSFNDSKVIQGETYQYSINSINNDYHSDSTYSNSITISIKPILAPTNLQTVYENNNITLTWIDQSSNETLFCIERKAPKENFFSLVAEQKENSYSFVDTSIIDFGNYSYRIKAKNQFTHSEYSDTSKIEIQPSLAPPFNLSAEENTIGEITIIWSDTSKFANKYIVGRRVETDSAFIVLDTIDIHKKSYTDKEITQAKTYFYRAASNNSDYTSDYSDTIHIKSMVHPIATPTSLTAEFIEKVTVLNWNDNSNNEEIFYIQRIDPDSTIYFVLDSVKNNIESFNDSTIRKDGLYKYRVFASNRFTNSPYSNISEISAIITSIISSDIPLVFSLSQNYPNPFNPSTMIAYDLPEPSHTKIEIFNLLGQRVDLLVNSEKPAGFYETTWNAANLPSGIYLVSINAEGLTSKKIFRHVKKALLLK